MSKANGNIPRPSVRPVKDVSNDDPFVYRLPIEVDETDEQAVADVTITVASLSKPFKTAGELRTMRNKSPLNIGFFVVERDCTAAQQANLDELTMGEFDTFSKAWAEHSGIDLGK